MWVAFPHQNIPLRPVILFQAWIRHLRIRPWSWFMTDVATDDTFPVKLHYQHIRFHEYSGRYLEMCHCKLTVHCTKAFNFYSEDWLYPSAWQNLVPKRVWIYVRHVPLNIHCHESIGNILFSWVLFLILTVYMVHCHSVTSRSLKNLHVDMTCWCTLTLSYYRYEGGQDRGSKNELPWLLFD